MTEPVQKNYNSIQEALMDYARLGANDRKERAKKVLYAYMDVEKDLSQPKILIHTFKELINQLQVSPGVIYCGDVLELCEELKNYERTSKTIKRSSTTSTLQHS